MFHPDFLPGPATDAFGSQRRERIRHRLQCAVEEGGGDATAATCEAAERMSCTW